MPDGSQVDVLSRTAVQPQKEFVIRGEMVFRRQSDLQGALICSRENFITDPTKIHQRLEGELSDRWDFDAFKKASLGERKGGLNRDEWKNKFIQWFENTKTDKNKHENMRAVLGSLLNIRDEQLSRLSIENMSFILNNYCDNNNGIKDFVDKMTQLKKINGQTFQTIQDVAGSLFGCQVLDKTISQMVDLEWRLRQPNKNTETLTKELSSIPLGANGIYLIEEMKKLLETQENLPQQNSQPAIVETKKENPTSTTALSIIGGRDKQEDFTLTKKEGLPAGIKSIRVVADCHGENGQSVSRFASEFFEAKLTELLRNKLPMEVAISQAVNYADKRISEYSSAGGTTLVATIELVDKVYVVNVGDSRAYYLSGDKITQISKDDNWLNQGEDKKGYKYGIQLSRSLGNNDIKAISGGEFTAQPHIISQKINNGDYILLATDGLYKNLSQEEIRSAIFNKTTSEAVATLIQAVKAKDPSDNVSISLLQH